MALQQVNSSIENTKFQMTQIQEAISALKKWEVEFNTYLAGVDAQSKQVLASTEELKIKEQQLDAEINAESQRQVDFQEENARDAQVDIFDIQIIIMKSKFMKNENRICNAKTIRLCLIWIK